MYIFGQDMYIGQHLAFGMIPLLRSLQHLLGTSLSTNTQLIAPRHFCSSCAGDIYRAQTLSLSPRR